MSPKLKKSIICGERNMIQSSGDSDEDKPLVSQQRIALTKVVAPLESDSDDRPIRPNQKKGVDDERARFGTKGPALRPPTMPGPTMPGPTLRTPGATLRTPGPTLGSARIPARTAARLIAITAT